jgi:hypothetical protein
VVIPRLTPKSGRAPHESRRRRQLLLNIYVCGSHQRCFSERSNHIARSTRDQS